MSAAAMASAVAGSGAVYLGDEAIMAGLLGW